jgi:hypothetical protein
MDKGASVVMLAPTAQLFQVLRAILRALFISTSVRSIKKPKIRNHPKSF